MSDINEEELREELLHEEPDEKQEVAPKKKYKTGSTRSNL